MGWIVERGEADWLFGLEFVGETLNPESNDLDVTVDLSLETLTSDFLALLQTVFPDPKTSPAFIVSLLSHPPCL